MLKKSLFILGWVVLVIVMTIVIALINHSFDTNRYNQLTQCHAQQGILLEEVQTGQYYCFPKERAGIK